jgi:uncharacterized protein (DUF2336 family)
MAARASAALIAELEGAADGRSPERCAKMLRQVTTLFLSSAHRFNEEQIALFDDVFLRLMATVNSHSLAHLSNNLCEVSTAPRKTIRLLAFHDDVLVAGPVLKSSSRLLDKDLIEVTNLRGEQHLLQISGRQTVDVTLSDTLVKRGEKAVLRTLVQNLGSRFSEAGYVALVAEALKDNGFAEKLAGRSDVPRAFRIELAAKVNDAQMCRLQAVSPMLQRKIQAAAAKKADDVESAAPRADYSGALAKMTELSRKGRLNDRSVNRFAVEKDYLHVVAALTFLAGAQIEVVAPLMRTAELDGLIVACKAARLNWSTSKMIIHNRPGMPAITDAELEQAEIEFDAISLSVAQRTIRLW